MSNKDLEGYTADFAIWKEHPITKNFFQFLNSEAQRQLDYLSSVYLNDSHPGNKLVSIGAFSHTYKMFKAFENLTANELFQFIEEKK